MGDLDCQAGGFGLLLWAVGDGAAPEQGNGRVKAILEGIIEGQGGEDAGIVWASTGSQGLVES